MMWKVTSEQFGAEKSFRSSVYSTAKSFKNEDSHNKSQGDFVDPPQRLSAERKLLMMVDCAVVLRLLLVRPVYEGLVHFPLKTHEVQPFGS